MAGYVSHNNNNNLLQLMIPKCVVFCCYATMFDITVRVSMDVNVLYVYLSFCTWNESFFVTHWVGNL